MIVQQLREYIREWLMEHEVAVSAVPAELVNRTRDTAEGKGDESSKKELLDYSGFEPTEYDDPFR